MNRSVVALLLSGLVFPGAGQYYLGRRARACLFIVPTLVAAFYFLKQVVDSASHMVDEVLRGSLSPDPVLIAERLHQQGETATPLMNIAAAVMLACWVASLVDAWLLARAQERGALAGKEKGMP
ncbi:hypothetical protein LXA47_01325 [Massilia sp. P8910]|uniref:hypothetical protein n=1 Tax=Massilia antarctica TaxID=2765360 RepID=UPI0006BB90ED|nr:MULTISPECIES: hypothetical protein [Massilia]MCE3602256.1 hypothetical protein [Massilia antarctica]MCY0912362.1 hypothetical protein [Massilia sp. H27-R4]CUI03467.1 hypothetical protein BN2497_1711 [Janthinobacterium sp. CG23_2]CUU27253.1 hypothetical protein BN3177_1711 [Janthinobacterium sp. CG23_2]